MSELVDTEALIDAVREHLASPTDETAALLARLIGGVKAWRIYHPAAARALKTTMLGWAREMAGRFGRPVYLCGSALKLPKPRDIDVRIVLTDAEFKARYGRTQPFDPYKWHSEWNEDFRHYAADMGKLSREGSLSLFLNLDFQVQPYAKAQHYADHQRLRLDDVDVEDAVQPEVTLEP